MQRTCKQCGKEFTITQNEIRFYKSKHLELPKRCGDCRKKNKMNHSIHNVSNDENQVEIKPSTTVSSMPSTYQETIEKTLETEKKKPNFGIVLGIIAIIAIVVIIALVL